MKTDSTKQILSYHIRFISNKGYEKLANMPGTKFVKEMYKVKDIVEVENKANTEGIRFCVAGLMKLLDRAGNKKPLASHWCPTWFFEYPLGETHLKKLGETLQNIPASVRIKGVLIGGLSEVQDSDGRYSLKLLRFFKAKTNHIKEKDFTMLLSQFVNEEKAASLKTKVTPETAFVYWEKTKTFFVNCGLKFDDGSERVIDILDKEGIKDHFEFIQPSKNDRFFLGSKQIPNEFLQKNDFLQRPSAFFPFNNH